MQPLVEPTRSTPNLAANLEPGGVTVPDHALLRTIGGGSYGEVVLARNAVGTLRAVKIVRRETFQKETHYEREFNGLKKFEPISRSHEGLMNILHIGRNDAEAYFYYVMELADSASGADPEEYIPRTLRHDLTARGALPFDECLSLAQTLAAALEHLHKHKLVHRDIKPSNIIFVSGQPKLADIGLVIETSEAKSFVGTDGYIPPEGPGTPQADLYSFGKILYEMSTGKDRLDFPTLPPALQDNPDRLQLGELNEVILKACAADVKNRYQAVSELRRDLERISEGKSVKRSHA